MADGSVGVEVLTGFVGNQRPGIGNAESLSFEIMLGGTPWLSERVCEVAP